MKSRCRGLLLSLTPIRTFFINNDGTGGHTTLYHNDLAKRSTSLKTRFKKVFASQFRLGRDVCRPCSGSFRPKHNSRGNQAWLGRLLGV